MNPTIILGCPGTGKTTYLLNEVEKLLDRGVAPESIGYVSFTQRAAQEASHRAQKKFGFTSSRLPWFRTLHSLCFAALGLTSSDVMESNRLKEFGDWIGLKISGNVSMDDGIISGYEVGDRCIFMENLARTRGITLKEQYIENNDNLPWFWVNRVSESLQTYKNNKHLYDFTDMLQMFIDSDWRVRLEYLFVDEGQDLGLLQWRVVEKLARGCREVTIAGDDDQAIYRWAGAAVEHFIGLPGKIIVLEQSWRVPAAPRELAVGLLSKIKGRRPKMWLPRVGETGHVARINYLKDIPLNFNEDTLILTRNTCFVKSEIIPCLELAGVYYEWRGRPSVRPGVVQGIQAWEHLREGGTVSVDEARAIYEQMDARKGYKHGHKKLPAFVEEDTQVSMADLRERGGLLAPPIIWHDALTRIRLEERVNMLRMLKRGQKITKRPRVRVSTIHGSKGGEADHVIVLPDMARRTYLEADNWPEDEARTWYVAVTRTRRDLTLLTSITKRSYDL